MSNAWNLEDTVPITLAESTTIPPLDHGLSLLTALLASGLAPSYPSHIPVSQEGAAFSWLPSKPAQPLLCPLSEPPPLLDSVPSPLASRTIP